MLFRSLDICVELDCQPGDLIRRVSERELEELAARRVKSVANRTRTDGAGAPLEPTRVYVVDLQDE